MAKELVTFAELTTKIEVVESKCWEWTGGFHGVGYGSISRLRFPECGGYAHRAMYLLAVGEIPKGMFVLHKCDNRKCVNPAHLFLGTHLDNIKDMHSKGRQKGGSMPGEKNPSVKFTTFQVEQIREMKKAGVRKLEIEKLFGISETQYYRIVNGISRQKG